jgi:hypothetical protein
VRGGGNRLRCLCGAVEGGPLTPEEIAGTAGSIFNLFPVVIGDNWAPTLDCATGLI